MLSHLLQMRGLKPDFEPDDYDNYKSHLLQMRGLKLPFNTITVLRHLVASFTDAWIETRIKQHIDRVERSRIFYRCVD